MHELLKENQPNLKISLQKYREIFGTEYSLSFFKPRKDQCVQCSGRNTLKPDDPNKDELEEKFKQHIMRKTSCRNAIKVDLENAKQESIIVATMDLQSVLQIPESAESAFYYKRKLCAYNLTFYVENESSGFCFLWSEIEGKRLSNEIGSCLKKFIEEQAKNGKTKIKLWSDNCGGQNRNQFITSMLLKLARELEVEYIEQNFLEPGHTQMSVDSMHSAIEHSSKHLSMYCSNDWVTVIRNARRKNLYKVCRLSYDDFTDFKQVHSETMPTILVDENREKVSLSKIKCIRYSKSDYDGKIEFKYCHEDDVFKVMKTEVGKRCGWPSDRHAWPKLYREFLTITEEKKNDLVNLCNQRLIPHEFHLFFKSLKTVTMKSPIQTSAEEESEDE